MSKLIEIVNSQPMTTSLVVAEQFDREHKNVLASISKLIESGTIGKLDFKLTSYTDKSNRQSKLYELTERGFLIAMPFIGGRKAEQGQAKLVDAFLSSHQQTPPAQLSRLDILKIALDAEEENQRLTAQAEEDAPKVEFHDRVVISEDAISVAKAAKIIGTGQKRLFAFLRQVGWVTRQNEPYQIKIEQGYLDVKLGEWDHPSMGLQKTVTTLVTGKGLAKLEKLYHQKNAA